jgi:hypothetical protein
MDLFVCNNGMIIAVILEKGYGYRDRSGFGVGKGFDVGLTSQPTHPLQTRIKTDT